MHVFAFPIPGSPGSSRFSALWLHCADRLPYSSTRFCKLESSHLIGDFWADLLMECTGMWIIDGGYHFLDKICFGFKDWQVSFHWYGILRVSLRRVRFTNRISKVTSSTIFVYGFDLSCIDLQISFFRALML